MPTIIQNADRALLAQIIQFVSKVDTYSGPFGLDPVDVTAIKDSKPFLEYILDTNDTVQDLGKGYTEYKNFVRHGSETPVAVPVIPAVVAYGGTEVYNIQGLLAKLIQQIVTHNGYIKAVGEDLGFEAPVVAFDPHAGKPVVKLKLIDGGFPHLHYKKDKFDGAEVQRWDMRTDTDFKKIDTAIHPNFIDHLELPAPGATAVIKYRMIYIYKGEQVGEWSDIVQIVIHYAA